MQVTHTIEETRHLIKDIKAQGKRIAFVPTMGNLHEGHLSLVRKAKTLADFVIVSIFANPMQFGPNEDFDRYPRTFEVDRKKLVAEQVDAIFAPTLDTMYPEGKETHTCVRVDALDGMHCGASRPNFFTGIATVIAKLLNIITPDMIILGEKDFQQVCILKKMVRDLMFPVEVVGIPTVRAKSGLALSSRNNYLNDGEKVSAAHLSQLLSDVAEMIEKKGERNFEVLGQYGLDQMEKMGFKPDYFNIVSQHTLKAPQKEEKAIVILAACMLGPTRLIDNIKIQLA